MSDAGQTPGLAPAALAGREIKRRPIQPAITEAVLTADGPGHVLKFFWLQLWSLRRSKNTVRRWKQSELAKLCRFKERYIRQLVSEAQAYHMLTIHRGHHGGESWYRLYEPRHWYAAPIARPAVSSPKRRSGLAPPPVASSNGHFPEPADVAEIGGGNRRLTATDCTALTGAEGL
jgi:hypothetical protein